MKEAVVTMEAQAGEYELSVTNVIDGVSRGRVPREGYQRGWGLQYDGLAKKVENDPVYQYALERAKGRLQNFSEMNRMNLFLILKFFLPRIPFGHVIEFGSYRGGSAIFMGAVCERLSPQRRIYALDTFEGMPATDKRIDAHSIGSFSNTSLPEVSAAVTASGLRNVSLVKGLFEQTTDAVLTEAGTVALAHIDCDIRSSCEYAQRAVRRSMVPGGYIVFDDATISSCLGATEAVEQMIVETGVFSEQIWPHFVFRHGLRDTMQAEPAR